MLEFKGSRVKEIMYLISGMKARKLLKKRSQGYLAYLTNKPNDQMAIGDMEVVKEFPDVFPTKLMILPPPRDMNFVIDLIPGAKLVSRTPYRMALPELKELKEPLEELLEQDYIRSDTSLWEAPMLFIKKKYRTLRLCIDYKGLNNR
jgi:hypothetical protein